MLTPHRQRARERQVCNNFGLPHVAGPGRPDCGHAPGPCVEVKDWIRPITPATVRAIASHRMYRDCASLTLVAVGPGGATAAAYDEADRLGIDLDEHDLDDLSDGLALGGFAALGGSLLAVKAGRPKLAAVTGLVSLALFIGAVATN